MKSRQLTQSALAAAAGMAQAHISNFLLGRRGLSIEGMDAILNVLGLDVQRLIAMSEQTRDQKDRPTSLESVPLVQHKAVMNSSFGKDEILGELGYTKTLVRRFSVEPTPARLPWVRFIAIMADAALAAPMYPRFEKGSVLLVDRHYCSLSGYREDGTNLYLVRKDEAVMVRWADRMDNLLCLRPDRIEYPLNFVSIDRRNPLTSFIVGRVVHIGTALENLVRRRRPSL